MSAFVTAGGGFLLAVLWFDLMFDVQARPVRGRGVLPGQALASITAYYGRVTAPDWRMNRLVAVAMVATLAACIVQVAQGDDPRWVAWTSLVLIAAATGLGGLRTVPAARRLGRAADPDDIRSDVARSLLRDHLICIALVAAVLVLQLASV